MVALVIGMLLCLGLAVVVVALVAVPARREGRDLLTPRGEEVVSSLKDRTEAARSILDRGPDEEPEAVTNAPEATPATTVPASPPPREQSKS